MGFLLSRCFFAIVGVLLTLTFSFGQTIQEAEYFIDVDPGPGQGITVPITPTPGSISETFTINTAGITKGQHEVYIRTKDDTGIWSKAWGYSIFLQDTVIELSYNEPRTIEFAEYFIDADPGPGMGTSVSVTGSLENITENLSINTTGISLGSHKVYLRTKDDKGVWSKSQGYIFYMQDTIQSQFLLKKQKLIAAEYFVDEDPGNSKGTPVPIIRGDSTIGKFSISSAGLSVGNHTVYVRTQDESGLWSLAKSLSIDVSSSLDDRYAIPSFTYDTVAAGQPTTFINTSDSVDENTLYNWDILNDSTTEYTTKDITHVFANSGIYEVKLTVVNDTLTTTYIGNVIVGNFTDRSIATDGPTTFCQGDSVLLTAPTGYEYIWNSGDTTQTITVSSSNTYYAWLIDPEGVQVRSEGVKVEVVELVDARVTTYPETAGLSNGLAQVNINGLTTGVSYTWNSSSKTTSYLDSLSAGSYSVTVSNANCQTILPFTIDAYVPGPDDIVAAEYFWDTEPGPGMGTPILVSGGNVITHVFPVPVEGLSIGGHELYIRTKANNGIWSLARNYPIVIRDTVIDVSYNEPRTLAKGEYFIDTDPGSGLGTPITISGAPDEIIDSFTLNMDGITPGEHKLYVRTQDDNGVWSQQRGVTFVLRDTTGVPQIRDNSIIAAEFFVDTDPGVGKAKALPVTRGDSTSGKFSISAAGLEPGEHYVYVRTQDEFGLWSLTKVLPIGVYPTEDDRYAIPSFAYDTVPPGSPTTFINTSDSVDSNTTYAWDILNDGSIEYSTQDITHTFSGSGYYEVKLIATNDTLVTTYIGTVIVGSFANRAINADGLLTFCQGDSVQLTAPSGYGYIWNTGDTTQSVNIKKSGTYSTWLIDPSGVQVRSMVAKVEVLSSISAIVETYPETSGLSNGFARVVVNGLTSDVGYTWSSSSNTSSFLDGLTAGNYSVSLTNGSCETSLPFTIGTYVPGPEDIFAAEYFWDTEPGIGNGTAILVSGSEMINHSFSPSIAGLPIGQHFLYVRTKANNGIWSRALRTPIQVVDSASIVPNIGAQTIVAAEYFIDSDPGIGNATTISVPSVSNSFSGQISTDISALADGVHTFYVRTKSDNGQWALTKSTDFQICQTIPPILTADDTLFVCPGVNATLTTTGEVGNTFVWYDADSVIINGATSASYSLGVVTEPTTYYAAQVSPGGCQSAWKQIAVIPEQTQVYAGVDEEIYYQGADFQLKGFFPKSGTWTGSIVNATGLISRANLSPGTYNLTYTYPNGGCTITDVKTVTVSNILNGNVPPDVTDQLLTIDENSLNGTSVGAIVSSDLNGDSLTFSIVSGNAGNTFTIDPSTGIVIVQDSLLLDYETTQQFVLGVDVSDPVITVPITLTIDVLPVNELFIVLDSTYSVDQSDPNGTSIGIVEAFDPDFDQLNYAITSGNADGAFSIDPTTAELILVDNSVLNTDVKAQYELMISVSDADFTVNAQAIIEIYSLRRDRLALIAFQQATNATLTNWGNAELDESWQGVNSIENGRVRILELPELGLSGVVPTQFADLTGLESINLSGNELVGFPNVSRFPNLDILDVSGNRLTMVDLLKNASIPNYEYIDQASFGQTVTDTIQAGTDSLLTISNTGMVASGNTYQWYFKPLSSSVFNPIANDDSVSYDIISIDFDQMGSYKVAITNPVLPDLVIEKNPITLYAETEISGLIFEKVTTPGVSKPLAGGLVDVYRIANGPYFLEDSTTISQEGDYRFEAVVLGDFMIKVTPEEKDSIVLQTYYVSQQDWVEADTLFLRQNASNIDIQMQKNPGVFGEDPQNTGFLIGNLFDNTSTSGRIDARRKVKKAGCSLRRRTRTGGGRGDQDGDTFELIAYVETDDEGNFAFNNIPPSYYRINIQYPGIPMDESSQIDFEITEDQEFVGFKANAQLTDEGIVISLDQVLGTLKPYLKETRVYPNPVIDYLNLKYLVYRQMDRLEMFVYTLSGELVEQRAIPHQMGTHQVELDLSEQSPGVYFLHLQNEDATFSVNVKLVKLQR